MANISYKPIHSPSLTLHRGWLERGKYVWSPFVTKLEARFRFAGLEYSAGSGSPLKAPKGKIPFIECRGLPPASTESSWTISKDSNTGSEVASLGDSSFITKALVSCSLLPDVNARLSAEDEAHDLALRALLEDRLYFYQIKERWVDNYYTMRDHALGAIPYPIRVLIGILAYRKQISMLYGQGTGRFSNEELGQLRLEIWETINDLLQSAKTNCLLEANDRPFWVLGGGQPTEADATVFGFVVSALICAAGPESKKVVRGFPVVVEYAERIHDRYFPDYEKW